MALLGVAATLAAASIAPKSVVTWQLAYFLVLFALIIPLHELGHAIAGAIVGYRVLNISVGTGPLPGHEQRLGARWSFPDCVSTLAGTEIIWCFSPRSPILYRVDGRAPRLTRVPGEIEAGWQHELLAPSQLAILNGDELEILDLEGRRGVRLTLPERNGHFLHLARGALATLQRPDSRGPSGTIVVYRNPFE